MVIIETPKGHRTRWRSKRGTGHLRSKASSPRARSFPSTSVSCPPRAPRTVIRWTCWSDGCTSLSGCIVPSRLIGVIEAEQTEDGKTERKDRVPAAATNSAAHRSIRGLRDLSQDLVAQVEPLFISYNEMKGTRSLTRAYRPLLECLLRAVLRRRIVGAGLMPTFTRSRRPVNPFIHLPRCGLRSSAKPRSIYEAVRGRVADRCSAG